MTSQPIQVERRAGQRFAFSLPVSLREPETGIESLGFTQDVSSRGLFLYTDGSIAEGAELAVFFVHGFSRPMGRRGRIGPMRPMKPITSSSWRA